VSSNLTLSEFMNQLTKIEAAPLDWRGLLMNPYGRRTYRFEVGMPARELMRKISAETAQGFLERINVASTKPFAGNVGDDSFAIMVFNKMKNSWRPVAFGEVRPISEKRSTVTIQFGMEKAIVVFNVIFMLVAIAIGCALLITGVFSNDAAILAALPAPLFLLGLTYMGAAMGKNEQTKILEYFSKLPDSQYQTQNRLIE
jgi:hypothetical protein